MVTQSIEVREEDGVRTLHFGSHWIQGAMRVARPYALELEYTREMLFPLLLRKDSGWPRRVLQIGLGAASLVKFLHRHRPQAMQTIVEIDPAVVQAARQFFKLPDDRDHLAIEVGDGGRSHRVLVGRTRCLGTRTEARHGTQPAADTCPARPGRSRGR